MPLLSVFLLMAQASRSAPTEVTLHHRRPSAVLATLTGLRAALIAHDDRGTVGIVGTSGDVEDARRVLILADVPRRPVKLRITVESPVDHLTWEVDARLVSGQRWQTSDDETGTSLVLRPLVDAEGNLTVNVVARTGKAEVASSMRLTLGKVGILALGTNIMQNVEVDRDALKVSETGMPLPKITIRYLG